MGFLQALITNQKGGKVAVFDDDVIDKVEKMRQEADDICKQAIPHVKRNYPQDYHRKYAGANMVLNSA